MADDLVGGCIGGCCLALGGAFQQFFNTKQWGTDCKCCDNCCRCECCWDEGEFDPNDRPGASHQQESGPKAADTIQRNTEPGDEDLPAYKPSNVMSFSTSSPHNGQAASSAGPSSTLASGTTA